MSELLDPDDDMTQRLIDAFDPGKPDDDVFSRADALNRLRYEVDGDVFPVELSDGTWLLSGEADRLDGRTFIGKVTYLVERDCPECGYDRADDSFWNNGVVQAGSVTCRACGHAIEQHDP